MLFFGVALLPGVVFAQEAINSFHSDITIHEDSTITVEETIEYEFGSRWILRRRNGRRELVEIVIIKNK